MGTVYENAREAANALATRIREIVQDGYSIQGLDITKVQIFPDKDFDGMEPLEPTDDPPKPVTPAPVGVLASGFDGDISQCCAAPAERRGTCLYCTACGSSNGCS